MYDNGRTAKCRPVLTAWICNGEAPSMTGIASVCLVFLIFLLKKCADYLAVWKIRVHTESRASRYKFSAKIQRVSGNKLQSFSPQNHSETVYTPYTSVAGSDGKICHARRRDAKYDPVPVCRRRALFPIHNIKNRYNE